MTIDVSRKLAEELISWRRIEEVYFKGEPYLVSDDLRVYQRKKGEVKEIKDDRKSLIIKKYNSEHGN